MKSNVLKSKWLQPAGLLLLLLLLALAAASCISENLVNEVNTGKEKLVTFSLTLPGQVPDAGTRVLTVTEEEDVKSVEVLLFNNSGNYVETRSVAEAEITPTGNIKKFTVKIPEGTYSSVVMLANSHSNVAGAGLSTSDSKAAVLAKLNVSNTGKWDTNTSSGTYKTIPMWGELGSITVNQATSNASTGTPLALNLIRMLAKVDVKLTSNALTDFNLQSIHVYNYYDKGSVAPLATNFSGGIATAASVPAGASRPAVTNPHTNLLYTGSEITAAGESSEGEIYLFEADNAAQTNLTDRTCLVIGGVYQSKTYYYRVDFVVNTSGTDVYLDVKRNHKYTFDVRKISGPGYSTPEEAFNARPFNIEATVVEWNDGDINYVATDGQYMLGVSQMTYNLAMDGYTAADSDNKLTITTDYHGGWSIVGGATPDAASTWLTVVAGDADGATGKKTIHLLLDPNNSGTPRTATLSIKAGTIIMKVTVNQSDVPNLGISIKDGVGINDISDLLFYSIAGTAPAPQQFTVSWAPKADECTILSSMMGAVGFDNAILTTLGTATAGLGTGKQTYTIAPAAIAANDLALAANPFLEKSSKVEFTISNGTSYKSSTIYLRQVNYAITHSTIPDFYMLNGTQYSFNVKSNTAWRIKSITEAVTSGSGPLLALTASDMKVTTLGGNNIGTGENITFTVVNNMSSLSGTVKVVFENPHNPQKFADTEVTLTLNGEYYPPTHKGWAGSNIYWNGTNLTFDDTINTTNQKYQGVYFQWGSLTGISPVGAWGGTTKLYPPSGGETTASTAPISSAWLNIPSVSTTLTITSTPPSGKGERDRGYLYEITSAATGKGDICKYLTDQGWAPGGKKWRMPTSNEFEAAGDYSWPGTWNAVVSAQADGKQTYAGWAAKAGTGVMGTSFPAAGYRLTNGALGYVGQNGYYWSGSPNGTGGYYLSFSSGGAYPGYGINRSVGFSVRCVVE